LPPFRKSTEVDLLRSQIHRVGFSILEVPQPSEDGLRDGLIVIDEVRVVAAVVTVPVHRLEFKHSIVRVSNPGLKFFYRHLFAQIS